MANNINEVGSIAWLSASGVVFSVSSVSRMERVQDGAQLHVTMRSILLLASSACHTIYWSRHVYVRCGGRIECAVSASQLFRARHGESFSLSLP